MISFLNDTYGESIKGSNTLNQYSISEFFKNTISLIYTKTFFKKARLIRLPVYIRGQKYFKYGVGFTTGYGCRIEAFSIKGENSTKINLGNNCKIGDRVHIAAGESIILGDNCLLASNIYISDISHGDYKSGYESSPDVPPDERPLITRPVFIGKNVWIGENVCILPGAVIGNGCIIGANSVVNKNIPDNCIVAGAPAKILKKYNNSSKKWEIFN